MLSTLWFYLQTRFVKDEEGQGMVEYGLILALIAIVAIVALTSVGEGLQGILGKITGELSKAAGTTP